MAKKKLGPIPLRLTSHVVTWGAAAQAFAPVAYVGGTVKAIVWVGRPRRLRSDANRELRRVMKRGFELVMEDAAPVASEKEGGGK